VSSPTNDEIWSRRRLQQARVAQYVKDGVGDGLGRLEIKSTTIEYFVVNEYDIAQYGEQQLANATNHHAVNKGRSRRSFQQHLEATILLRKPDTEALKPLQQCPSIIGFAAGIQDGKHAASQQRV
jgi:hypothetical protein